MLLHYCFIIIIYYHYYLSSPKDIFLLTLERERDGERDRVRNIDVREKHQLAASCVRPNGGSNLQPLAVQDDAPTN